MNKMILLYPMIYKYYFKEKVHLTWQKMSTMFTLLSPYTTEVNFKLDTMIMLQPPVFTVNSG